MTQARIADTLPARSISAGSSTVSVAESAINFDRLYVARPRLWLVVLLIGFFVVAVRYASLTPNWQAPDEPAHYNYIADIATNATLPVLRMGDYNQRHLGYLVNLGFPADHDISRIRYESYQPPLYYIAATPVFWFTDGSLFALRLFNVYLGLAALLLLYLCLELVFPTKPLIPLGATAFAALLPMHVAVASAVNNDVLAEVLVLAASLALLHWMRGYFYRRDDSVPFTERETHRNQSLLLTMGVLLGLGLLTKIYLYAVLPIFAGVVLWTIWSRERTWRTLWLGIRANFWVLLPALAIALPMWLRNLLIYPNWDVLALRWHDLVVQGQPTTAAWIADYGAIAYFERAFGLTFRSFWGVFGWLSVAMDERIYTAALLFTGILFLGLLWACVRLISGAPDTDMDRFQVTVLAVFGVLLLTVAAGYVWYNMKFVQHQGRYFFWGMLAISTVVALGWREVLHPLQGTITGMLALALAASMAVSAYMGDEINNWTLLTVLLFALFLILQPLLLIGTGMRHPWRRLNRLAPALQRGVFPQVLFGLRFLAWATPFLLLFVLNLAVPTFYIVPQLPAP